MVPCILWFSTKMILANNSLREIPEDIATFPTLAVLDCRDNEIESIAASIGQLQELKSLTFGYGFGFSHGG